jgi:hypothetical protein
MLDSILEPVTDVKLSKEVFMSKGKVNALDHRVKHFCKYVLSFEVPSTSLSCNP